MSHLVRKLGHEDLPSARELLLRDPVQNLYLLGVLEDFGLEPNAGETDFFCWGHFFNGRLSALVFVGGGPCGLALPSASEPRLLAALAQELLGKISPGAWLGESAAVEALVEQLGPKNPVLRRPHHLFCASADDLGPFTNPLLRLADEQDADAVTELANGAIQETLGKDPLSEASEHFRAHVRKRIRLRRTYVLEEGGKLVFKVDVGSRSRHGAELEGLYTIPEMRGHGIATLCLGQLSRHLLSALPRLTLRIHGRDAPLATVARKVGYAIGKAQTLVLT